MGSVLVYYYYYYYSLLIYEGIDRYIKAEYTLLYSTLDAYMPPVQGKSREYKPVEFNHRLEVIHASIESKDVNPVQSNPASRTAG